MSCRVLNRTVEEAVFAFILKKAAGKQVRGEYIPTDKNKLVRLLYETLGFQKISKISDDNINEQWLFSNSNLEKACPEHYVLINEI